MFIILFFCICYLLFIIICFVFLVLYKSSVEMGLWLLLKCNLLSLKNVKLVCLFSVILFMLVCLISDVEFFVVYFSIFFGVIFLVLYFRC